MVCHESPAPTHCPSFPHKECPFSSTVHCPFNILNFFFHISLTECFVVRTACPSGPMQFCTKIKPPSASSLRASFVLTHPTLLSFQTDLVLQDHILQPTASSPSPHPHPSSPELPAFPGDVGSKNEEWYNPQLLNYMLRRSHNHSKATYDP